MISQSETDEIKKITQEFLYKMTVADFQVEVMTEKNTIENSVVEDVVLININLSKDPQFLIGKDGQTLFDLQKVLRVVINRKLKKVFYIKLDINDYQKQKTEYLKKLAKSLADEAVLNKEKRVFPPMPSRERRIIHEELAKRQDVVTESQGEGYQRCVIINPR